MAFGFLVREAFRSLFRSKRLNLIALGSISLALMALGLVLLLQIGMYSLTHLIEQKVEVVAFLDDSAQPADLAGFMEKVKSHPQVVQVRYISKETALQEFTVDPYLKSFLDALGSNPLPASLQIQLKEKSAENIQNFAQWLQQLPGITEASFGGGDAARLLKVLHFIRLAVIILTLSLVLAAVMIIANIISFMVFARQEEIRIMRLIGATNWFIRGPFLIWGLVQGMLGGFLASGLLGAIWIVLAYYARNELSLDLYALLPPAALEQALIGSAGLTLLGSFLGLIGSLLSVGRELQE